MKPWPLSTNRNCYQLFFERPFKRNKNYISLSFFVSSACANSKKESKCLWYKHEMNFRRTRTEPHVKNQIRMPICSFIFSIESTISELLDVIFAYLKCDRIYSTKKMVPFHSKNFNSLAQRKCCDHAFDQLKTIKNYFRRKCMHSDKIKCRRHPKDSRKKRQKYLLILKVNSKESHQMIPSAQMNERDAKQRVKHLAESALVEPFRSLLFVPRIGQRFARPHTGSSVQRESNSPISRVFVFSFDSLGSSHVVKCIQVCSRVHRFQISAAIQCGVMIIFADCIHWYSCGKMQCGSSYAIKTKYWKIASSATTFRMHPTIARGECTWNARIKTQKYFPVRFHIWLVNAQPKICVTKCSIVDDVVSPFCFNTASSRDCIHRAKCIIGWYFI